MKNRRAGLVDFRMGRTKEIIEGFFFKVTKKRVLFKLPFKAVVQVTNDFLSPRNVKLCLDGFKENGPDDLRAVSSAMA